jgi:hypothetical protein
VAVNAQWDELAQASNGGAGCNSARVIGRPLLDFVAGDATRMFVRAALSAVRLLHQKRVLPYRCDSPSERRRFEMVISPLQNGHVLVEHVLVHAQARPPSLQRWAASGRQRAGRRCSQCLSVKPRASQAWRSAEDVDAPLLATDVCPPCMAQLVAFSVPD